VAAERTLWNTIRLNSPQHYGLFPHIRPDVKVEQFQEGFAEGLKADRVCEEALKAKCTKLIKAGNDRRWNHVRTLMLFPRPRAILGMTTILDLASPTLVSLKINPAIPSGPSRSSVLTWIHDDPLEVSISQHKLYFPALSHLWLGAGSLQTLDIIPYLCYCAPVLTSLDLYVSRKSTSGAHSARSGFHRSTPPSIKQLRIKFETIEAQTHPIVLELLDRCRNMRQLSIGYEAELGMRPVPLFSALVGIIGKYKNLNDLCWEVDCTAFIAAVALIEETTADLHLFQQIRRLVLKCKMWWCDLVSYCPIEADL
jgi:hypothetical protein